MGNINRKCIECGELLQSSQYARLKKEGEPAKKEHESLVCMNYPKCTLAEKIVE